MSLKDLFQKANTDIEVIKKTENSLIFHVNNGKGLLCEKYGCVEDRGFYTLIFDNIPLIKFHGDEYLCPTCEKLVSAGYGLDTAKDKTIYKLSNVLNEPFVSLEKSFSTSERLTDKEAVKYISMINNKFDNFSWPSDLLNSSKSYYDVYTHACIQWAGDLSNDRIDKIFNKEEFPDEIVLSHIINALYGIKSSRFLEFAFFLGKNRNYINIWGEVFSLLSEIKSEEVENFFIDFLVYDDKIRRDLTRIADTYFITN